MKIALAQLNFHVGNFAANTQKIITSIEKAQADLCELIVFSELAVCGYPPLDLLEREAFVQQCLQQIDVIASRCQDITAVVGCPSINDQASGKKLFNSAFVLSAGKIQSVHHKTLLPNYDVFDEYRYFEPNRHFSLVEVNGKKMALTICEDLWDEQPVANSFAKDKLYTNSPMQELKKLNPDFVVNIAASPFSYNQGHIRHQIISQKAIKNKLPFVYVNQVGANTELVFDGSSLVVNSKGQIVNQLNSFKEDIQYCYLQDVEQDNVLTKVQAGKMQLICDALVLGVRDYFSKTGFTKATLGLSGGLDSAVTLVIAEQALGAQNLRVLLLPSKYSSEHSIKDAEELANNLNVAYDILPIGDIVDSYEHTLNPLFKGLKPDLTEENIQARIRGSLLMALSNKFGHILLNTSNKSEAAVGYGTLYGDMNGGLSVLGDVYKTDVFALARYINRKEEIIPVNTIVKPPSAELRPDQKDSDSLPDYEVLDQILFNYIEKNQSQQDIIAAGFDADVVKKAIRMVNLNEYKRFQTAPIIRVSSKAFGMGRRIPLVTKF
ncbi:NAD+ synthase (glutamine-hydrolysing) [Saccharicrinis carchari]|uniref:Glutamine-dependent NAD(+) synthetase n=1 Tax=Saccharicrinis carchari TaxID=1168039 RepID=A0A521DB02_SACCC|nr:NAD+ synthase [Saccharicrinis carchari]SMO68828.1 NAD+ synthase (glutamine-hydrolysing) [Saccharicrinis carchari]